MSSSLNQGVYEKLCQISKILLAGTTRQRSLGSRQVVGWVLGGCAPPVLGVALRSCSRGWGPSARGSAGRGVSTLSCEVGAAERLAVSAGKLRKQVLEQAVPAAQVFGSRSNRTGDESLGGRRAPLSRLPRIWNFLSTPRKGFRLGSRIFKGSNFRKVV